MSYFNFKSSLRRQFVVPKFKFPAYELQSYNLRSRLFVTQSSFFDNKLLFTAIGYGSMVLFQDCHTSANLDATWVFQTNYATFSKQRDEHVNYGFKPLKTFPPPLPPASFISSYQQTQFFGHGVIFERDREINTVDAIINNNIVIVNIINNNNTLAQEMDVWTLFLTFSNNQVTPYSHTQFHAPRMKHPTHADGFQGK